MEVRGAWKRREPTTGRSFNGRTRRSGRRYRGSNPCLPANSFGVGLVGRISWKHRASFHSARMVPNPAYFEASLGVGLVGRISRKHRASFHSARMVPNPRTSRPPSELAWSAGFRGSIASCFTWREWFRIPLHRRSTHRISARIPDRVGLGRSSRLQSSPGEFTNHCDTERRS